MVANRKHYINISIRAMCTRRSHTVVVAAGLFGTSRHTRYPRWFPFLRAEMGANRPFPRFPRPEMRGNIVKRFCALRELTRLIGNWSVCVINVAGDIPTSFLTYTPNRVLKELSPLL